MSEANKEENEIYLIAERAVAMHATNPDDWMDAEINQAHVLLGDLARHVITETERHNDMLALVETLADQVEHGMHSSIQAWAVKEARRILALGCGRLAGGSTFAGTKPFGSDVEVMK